MEGFVIYEVTYCVGSGELTEKLHAENIDEALERAEGKAQTLSDIFDVEAEVTRVATRFY